MAPPLKSLQGAVIGMIDNAKINTEQLFDHIADILRKEHGVHEFIRKRKPDATRPVAPEMLAQMMGADASDRRLRQLLVVQSARRHRG
jgi:hypothetical protein